MPENRGWYRNLICKRSQSALYNGTKGWFPNCAIKRQFNNCDKETEKEGTENTSCFLTYLVILFTVTVCGTETATYWRE